MQHTIYVISIDTHNGGRGVDLYATPEQFAAAKRQIILNSEDEDAIALLEKNPDEAWSLCVENGHMWGDHYDAEETTIDLPTPASPTA